MTTNNQQPAALDLDQTNEQKFSEWLSREMPPGTVINDPTWWARRILRAAITQPAAAPAPAAAQEAAHADEPLSNEAKPCSQCDPSVGYACEHHGDDDEDDVYNHACEIMEQHQRERAARGVEIGTQGSLCDGIAWLYSRLEKLEAAQAHQDAAPTGFQKFDLTDYSKPVIYSNSAAGAPIDSTAKAEPVYTAEQVRHAQWIAHENGVKAGRMTAELSIDTDRNMAAVAFAVVSKKGGIHKLSITRESAERKAAVWREEWPNNGCEVRELFFAAGMVGQDAKDAAPGGMKNQATFRAACQKRGIEPSQATFELWQDARAAMSTQQAQAAVGAGGQNG